MDRPMGPRQPDPKRHAAFESIFGRPTPSAPPQAAPRASYTTANAPTYQYNGHLNAYPQQAGYPGGGGAALDRRPSALSAYGHPTGHSPSPPYAQSPPPPTAYRQSYYPSQAPPSQQQPQGYYPYPSPQPPPQNAYPSPSLAPPAASGRARSMVSQSGQHAGIISPRPEADPPDPALEVLTKQGMTPAQAYQYQVYMNNNPGQHPFPSNYPGGQQRNSYPNSVNGSNQSPRRSPVNDMLGVHVEDGRLALDFLEGGSGGGSSPSDGSAVGTDDGSSELPWRDGQRNTLTAIQSREIQHLQTRVQQLQLDTRMHTGAGGSASAPSSASAYSSTTQSFYASSTSTAVHNTSPSPSSLHAPSPDLSLNSQSTRRSSESTRTMPMPLQGSYKRDRSYADRSRSMSATVRGVFDPNASLGKGARDRPGIPNMASGSSSHAHHHSHAAPHTIPLAQQQQVLARRTPIVYPALLSRVALAFRERITLADRTKDGLTYHDAFDGREAVDKIAYIIKTTDRNLALLLGRALDAQKFFHDVTYDHRLRDSSGELYQFGGVGPKVWGSGELAAAAAATKEGKESTPEGTTDGHGGSEQDGKVESPDTPTTAKADAGVEETPLPSGVFTLLTDCYSPTCSRDRLCYSIACPRRLEQQARLNMKPQPGLKKQISKESLGDLVEPGTLWIHSVPKEVVDSVSDQEKKRQEAINEVIYTERDFVRDMEYLRDIWINPLKQSDVIPAHRRTDFLEQVFWNIHDIIAVNTRLRDALNKRQKQYAVVERIGDILLDAVPHFAPFVSYGAHQLYGKYEFEREKGSNPAFAQFVEMAERLPESRKLELNGYLTKPTTRLARYPLLLEAVLKHTPDDNPDKVALPQAVALVREFLARVNTESGKTENRFNLLQLDQQLVFRPGEEVDLRLKEEGRELVYKGPLKKRSGGQGDSGELQVFLFDHALLMVKQKTKHEQYKVYRRPIPLELLVVSAADDFPSTGNGRSSKDKSTKSLIKRNSFTRSFPNAPIVAPVKGDSKGSFSMTFVHLGRKYYSMTLYASTYVSQRKWVENIQKQQDLMRERSLVFYTETLNEGFFLGPNKVNCAAPYNAGRRVVYGTDDGVYISDLMDRGREPLKVLALMDVTQIDVLEEYQLLVVLSEKQVITFPLEALDPRDPMAGLKRAKRISSHISFFKAGYCLGKALVCVVKSSPLSSTIKAFEPIDQNVRRRKQPTFKSFLAGGNDTLKVFREFYIPVESSSIHFLKTLLCVGCTKGFEVVDLETLETQGLLDPADESLEFVSKRDGLRPMAIFRIDNEFLLCYDEFAFYVNKNGWRSRKEVMVHWEGSPTGFALRYPYVIAFEPTFVEIRHVETGAMAQIIQGNNLRLLFADMPPKATTNSQMSAQYPYNPYSPYPNSSAGSRQSLYGAYGGANPQFPTPNPYRRNAFGRDEIILVSDDRVMMLRMAGEDQHQQQYQQQPQYSPQLSPYPGMPVRTSQMPLPPLPVSDTMSMMSASSVSGRTSSQTVR
ncbi:CNH-domain-containing protein [Punctularia strigosozonata HHB-11173 SS5]|uniref:CNH-domain-containing protein n=1 Tax=Punctularia strigosozonata (strain HHB-11173) TaxID=741275 RepID=UPI0004417157|nr:CNH-domain-containing protein [Punctularia strigosozonata HHB-11173 SS5]EIN09591.1 CNH-domain-containing protein [Punctularia strigosozonata HHB-11173 SS5]